MYIKVDFRYMKETWSFLNKTFTKFAVIFFIFLFIVGVFVSDFKTTIQILSFILFVYFLFGIKTFSIIKKQNNFKKNGKKCLGIIKDIKVERKMLSSNKVDDWGYMIIVYLIVEYTNPYTNKVEQFTTEKVNGNPYNYLSSLDVTVYVLPDGTAWATDFKKIKKLSDSVKYKTDEKYKKSIDNQENNKFKYILYYIIFFLVFGFIITKANFITAFLAVLAVPIVVLYFKNKK